MEEPSVMKAVRMLASVCDGSRQHDGQGFNAVDAPLGHSLASQDSWTPRQVYAAWRMLRKYKGQLEGFGINYDDIPEPTVPEMIEVKSNRRAELHRHHCQIYFDYDPNLVYFTKMLPNARFVKNKKYWHVDYTPASVVALSQYISEHGFEVTGDDGGWIARYMEEMNLRVNLSQQNEEDGLPLEYEERNPKVTLRPFQRGGVTYALRSQRCFIADDMGLGKTIQSIVAVDASDMFPVVCVVPASVKIKWAREWKKWTGLESYILEGQTPHTIPNTYGIIIINYDILDAWVDTLVKFMPSSVILDESHYCKNSKAKRTKAAKKLVKGVSMRLLLTGTPIENGPYEFWPQIQILGRDKDMGGFWYFVHHFCGAKKKYIGPRSFWDYSGATNLEELNDLLRSTGYIRRRKADVAKDLPPKMRAVVPVEIDNMKEYRQARDNFLAWVSDKAITDEMLDELAMLDQSERLDALAEARAEAVQKASAAEVITQLNALKRVVSQGKYVAAKEWIDDFRTSGEKLIVFAWHRDLVQDLSRAYGCPKIIGGMNSEDRQKAADDFMKSKAKKNQIIVCNMKAAGVGVDLYAASNVLFLELGWTSTLHDQAEDRAHRIGQTADRVTAWYLLAEKTVEEDIYDLIEEKRKIVTAATDGGKDQSSSIVRDLLNRMMEG